MRGVWRLLAGMMCLVGAGSVGQAAEAPRQLSGADLEMAAKMNDAYARHMYSSACVDTQESYFIPPKTMPAADKARILQSFKTSCDCLTANVMKAAAPNDVINYVTTVNGGRKSGSTPDEGETRAFPDLPQGSVEEQKMFKIIDVGRDPKIRKDCGFTR